MNRDAEASQSTIHDFPIRDKRIFITGATNGVGRSLLKISLNNGAIVTAHGRSEEKMETLLHDLDRSFSGVAADLRNRDEWPKVEAAIIAQSPDILILNAGYNCGKKPVSEWTDSEIFDMYNANLLANIFFIRAFTRQLKCTVGKSVTIVLSAACFYPRENMGLYNSAKFALMGFGKTMQQEALHGGVKTVLFYPGRVNSGFRETPNEKYMSSDSVAHSILSILSLPGDVVPNEFVFRPEGDHFY